MNPTNYKLSISWLGILAFLIPMIPNILWALLRKQDDYLTLHEVARPILDPIQNTTQALLFILLFFVIHKQGSIVKGRTLIVAIIITCLWVYLILWVIYALGVHYSIVMIGLAVVPSLYFILFALYQRNYYAMMIGIVFGISHTIISTLNLVCKS